VIFEGDLGIKNAVAIKNAIQALKFSGSSVIMHLENVEKLDVTTIQTFNALKIALKSKGINTEVLVEVPADIEKLMKNTGFNKTL
jgi:anti-anti-sigma regulatory factor